MPRQIIKYLCDFKCGKKAMSDLNKAKYHQAVFFKNPENKCCTTCKHERYEEDSWDDGVNILPHSEMIRGCNNKNVDEDKYNELIEASDYHSTPIFHKQPVRNFPFWEKK